MLSAVLNIGLVGLVVVLAYGGGGRGPTGLSAEAPPVQIAPRRTEPPASKGRKRHSSEPSSGRAKPPAPNDSLSEEECERILGLLRTEEDPAAISRLVRSIDSRKPRIVEALLLASGRLPQGEVRSALLKRVSFVEDVGSDDDWNGAVKLVEKWFESGTQDYRDDIAQALIGSGNLDGFVEEGPEAVREMRWNQLLQLYQGTGTAALRKDLVAELFFLESATPSILRRFAEKEMDPELQRGICRLAEREEQVSAKLRELAEGVDNAELREGILRMAKPLSLDAGRQIFQGSGESDR